MKIQEVFNMMMESNVGNHSGAGILFFNGKDVLVLKDSTSKWGFPGGKPVQGETPEQTAERESIEEVGSCPGEQVDVLKFENDNRIFYSYFYKVTDRFNVKLSDEHVKYKWIPFKTLKDIPLKRYVKKNLKQILTKLELISRTM